MQEEKTLNTTGPQIDRKIGRWLMVLSQIVFLIVVVGGTVRLTGSGLSIPDWPLINGSLMFPASDADWLAVYRTYHREIAGVEVTRLVEEEEPGIVPIGHFKKMFAIEYFHRFLAAAFGLLFLFVFIKVVRDGPARRKFGMWMTFAFCLLLVQAMLGGLVVKTDLEAVLVAVHLGVACVFFAILFWMGLAVLFPAESRPDPGSRFFYQASVAAGLLVFTQMLSGGMVAGTLAGYHLNTWPLIGDYLVPPVTLLWSSSYAGPANLLYNKLLLQFIHRWWAFVAVAAVLYLTVKSLKVTISPRARLGMRSLSALVVLQLILGIFTLIYQVPAGLAVMHQAVGFLLFELLVLLTYEFRNHGVQAL
ncbi:MAG: COX15/CtaA family protein [Candidatus Glassbacteria bacterium]